MDWKNQLTKTPYLVLFIVLITVGVGTASALITITLAGNVVITGDLTLQEDLICEDCIGGSEIAGTTKLIFGSCNLSIPSMNSGAFLADLPCTQAGVSIGDKVVANLSNGNFCHTITVAMGVTDAVEFGVVNACSFNTSPITDIVNYIVFKP